MIDRELAMKTACLAIAALSLMLCGATATQAADMGKIKPQICGNRATCRMSGLQSAGMSETGLPLFVAELHFGLADKPKDGPEDGCHTENGDNDGGVEYWLIEGEKPRLLLSLCNDGYGAAGVGYDEVHIASNRFTHMQDGGSNDRWENIDTISLSPQHTLRSEFCGFRGTEPNYGVYGVIDVPHMAASELAIDDTIELNDNDDACTRLKKRLGKPIERGYLGGVAVPFASTDTGSVNANALPEKGMTLGSCASVWKLDGKSGNLVYGKADPARQAEIRFVGDFQNLVLQIYDPRRDHGAPQSWVNADHLELWTTTVEGFSSHVDPKAAMQIGIDLDGQVHAGLGKPVLPAVERWEATDEQNRPVIVLKLHWPSQDDLAAGLGIAYSQAEGGRQERIFATTQIAKNRPLYLPSVMVIPVACGAINGRWEVTENPGQLEPQGD
jgi:hypothetical protein